MNLKFEYMKKYEYLVIDRPAFQIKNSSLENFLNEYGKNGWEFCAFTNIEDNAIFKRVIPET